MITAKWCDQWRQEPLTFHRDINAMLEKITAGAEMPHMLFYGPAGSGKSTRAHFVLQRLFRNAVLNYSHEYITIPETREAADKLLSKTEKSVETVTGKITGTKRKDGEEEKDEKEKEKDACHTFGIFVIHSDYHVEVTPSDAAHKDVHVLRFLTRGVDTVSERLSVRTDIPTFKLFIINQAHLLSYVAQCSLRRIMETKSKNIRFIFLSESLSSMIEPVRSRCHCVRFPSPPFEDIVNDIMNFTVKKYPQIPRNKSLFEQMVNMASCNVSFAITIAENYAMSHLEWRRTSKESAPPPLSYPEWMQSCYRIMDEIMEVCQTRLPLGEERQAWRKVLYDLTERCVSPTDIVLKLMHRFLMMKNGQFVFKIREDIQREAMRMFAEKEAQIHRSSYRPIILLDSILSNVISLSIRARLPLQ